MNIQDKMDMIADNPRLIDVKPLHSALQSVLDLHKPTQGHGVTICEACSETEDALFMECPCPTVRAIENTLKEHT